MKIFGSISSCLYQIYVSLILFVLYIRIKIASHDGEVNCDFWMHHVIKTLLSYMCTWIRYRAFLHTVVICNLIQSWFDSHVYWYIFYWTLKALVYRFDLIVYSKYGSLFDPAVLIWVSLWVLDGHSLIWTAAKSKNLTERACKLELRPPNTN